MTAKWTDEKRGGKVVMSWVTFGTFKLLVHENMCYPSIPWLASTNGRDLISVKSADIFVYS